MSGRRSWTAWLVFPGPVFRRELGSAARGRRLYLARALAAAGLAVYVGSSIGIRQRLSGAEALTLSQIAELATRAFRVFGSSQFLLVLAMVPLLVAGSVAEEKERGTLGLLLAGRLSALEIVADKLAARMLLVLVLMLAFFPVLALIGLLGGIDPGDLLLFYGMTLSTAWFASGLSMFVSVHARSASGAIVGAYLAGLTWVVLPVWFVAWLGTTGPPGFVAMLRPIACEVARCSPLSMQYPKEAWGRWVMTPGGRTWMIAEMASLQMAGGLILFGLAAWRLRPVYRAQVGGVRARKFDWLARFAGLWGRSRSACGDDPIAWKERYAPESAWLARLAILLALALIAYSTIIHLQWPQSNNIAFDEMFTYGLEIGEWGAHGVYRTGLNYVLCEKSAILYFASLVAVSILSASSVAGERGRGTWSSLLSTPLDRPAILRSKMLGAIRPVRVLLGMIVFYYLASLAATAMHPVGFVLVLLALASFLWFAAALGIYISLRSKNATRAIGSTVMILAAVNLAPAAAHYPFIGPSSMMISTPMLAVLLPMSRMQFRSLARGFLIDHSVVLALAIVLGVVLAHAAGAWLLTRAAARRIERDVG